MSARDILTEEELNTLLNEEPGSFPIPENAVQDGVPLNFYDFISEYHKSITKTKGFINHNVTFSANLKNKINSITNQHWHIIPGEVEVTTYEQYLKNNNRSYLNVLKLQDANQLLVCSFDQTMISGAIESLFGGSANNISSLHNHGLINTMLCEQFSTAICESLQNAWQSIFDLELSQLDSQDDAIISKLKSSNNKIIVCHYVCQDQLTTAQFDICLPHSLFSSVSDLLSQDEHTTDHPESESQWRSELSHNINNANIALSAEITETQIHLKDALNLKVGDVITIDNPHLGYLLAEGTKLFKMKCGARDGTKVVELLEPIQY